MLSGETKSFAVRRIEGRESEGKDKEKPLARRE